MSKNISFRKCRFDKCLSVGLLPYLVNTPNRKNKRALPQIKKSSTSEQVENPDNPELEKEIVLRSESQISTPALQILFNSGLNQNENVRLRPDDLFENGLILLKVGQVMDDIFFNENMDESLALYSKEAQSIGISNSLFLILRFDYFL